MNKFHATLLLALLFFSDSAMAQSTNSLQGSVVASNIWVKSLFDNKVKEICTRIPHLNNILIDYTLPEFYWHYEVENDFSLGIKLDCTIKGFVMEMPGGGLKTIHLSDPGFSELADRLAITYLSLKNVELTANAAALGVTNQWTSSSHISRDKEGDLGIAGFKGLTNYAKTNKINGKKLDILLTHTNLQVSISKGEITNDLNSSAISRYINGVYVKYASDKKKEENDRKVKTSLQNATTLQIGGNLEGAKNELLNAKQFSNDPSLQAKIREVDKQIADQKAVKKETSTNNQTTNSSGNKSSSFTNTGKGSLSGTSSSNTTRNSQAARKEAERKRIQNKNNQLLQQGNRVYQQSFETEKAIDKAANDLKKLFGGSKTPAQLAAERKREEALDYAEELREERRWQREEDRLYREKLARKNTAAEKKRIETEKAKLESTRKNLLALYGAGNLPSSAIRSTSNNQFYFVYAYEGLRESNPALYLTNVFAIGKYPDNTWPLKTNIEKEIYNLTQYGEVIHGPFNREEDAQKAYTRFRESLSGTGMLIRDLTYGGKNAHGTTIFTHKPLIDFWGNPILEKGETKKDSLSVPPKKVVLDEWGNPIKQY